MMTERESSEVEKVLLHIGDARARAKRAADTVEKEGAPKYVVSALRDSEHALADLHRTLSQGTYYAVPDSTMRMAV